MSVVRNIVDTVTRNSQDRRITRVLVGIGYTAVSLDSNDTGVAYTFPKGIHSGSLNDAGKSSLAGRRVDEVAAYLRGQNLLLSSVALAASNAVLASLGSPPDGAPGDVLQNVTVRAGDRVCMIGCFFSVMSALQKMNVEVTAIDDVPEPGTSPSKIIRESLPKSQVAIITGTSIINDTIDGLLDMAGECREVVVLGPSTPVRGSIYRETPATCVSGIRVSEPERVFDIVGEGGGFRAFRPCVQKINVRLR